MKQGCDDMGMTPEQAFQQALSLSKIYAKKTIEGEGAIKGKDGFSPTVVENPDNTNMDYRLDITTATGIYTTPNLMGPQGLKGEVGAQGIPGPQGRDGVQGQQGIQGIQGPKGDDGYPFLIYKEYASLDDFDASDFPEIGLMFMIKTDGAETFPVYRYTGEIVEPYSYITDLTGSEGIKGEKGDKGDAGPQGVPGKDGNDGTTYTPIIGNVTSGETADARVVLDEEEKTAEFSFVLPVGAGDPAIVQNVTKIANISTNGTIHNITPLPTTGSRVVMPATGWLNILGNPSSYISVRNETSGEYQNISNQAREALTTITMAVTKGDSLYFDEVTGGISEIKVLEVPPVDGTLYIKAKNVLYTNTIEAYKTFDAPIDFDMDEYDELYLNAYVIFSDGTIMFASSNSIPKDGKFTRMEYLNYNGLAAFGDFVIRNNAIRIENVRANKFSMFIGFDYEIVGIKYARADEIVQPIGLKKREVLMNENVASGKVIDLKQDLTEWDLIIATQHDGLNGKSMCSNIVYINNVTELIYPSYAIAFKLTDKGLFTVTTYQGGGNRAVELVGYKFAPQEVNINLGLKAKDVLYYGALSKTINLNAKLSDYDEVIAESIYTNDAGDTGTLCSMIVQTGDRIINYLDAIQGSSHNIRFTATDDGVITLTSVPSGNRKLRFTGYKFAPQEIINPIKSVDTLLERTEISGVMEYELQKTVEPYGMIIAALYGEWASSGLAKVSEISLDVGVPSALIYNYDSDNRASVNVKVEGSKATVSSFLKGSGIDRLYLKITNHKF